MRSWASRSSLFSRAETTRWSTGSSRGSSPKEKFWWPEAPWWRTDFRSYSRVACSVVGRSGSNFFCGCAGRLSRPPTFPISAAARGCTATVAAAGGQGNRAGGHRRNCGAGGRNPAGSGPLVAAQICWKYALKAIISVLFISKFIIKCLYSFFDKESSLSDLHYQKPLSFLQLPGTTRRNKERKRCAR